MKIILTGATGFVGRNLVAHLKEAGHQIKVIVRDAEKASDIWGQNVEVCQLKMKEYKSYLPKDAECGYDIFVHLAWDGTSGEKRGDYRKQLENIEYACDAVELAQRFGCKRFAYAGSIMEYDAESLLHSNEGMNPSVAYIYSSAKLSADLMLKSVVAEKEMEYVNFTISNIFGPGEKSERFINTVVRKMLRNEPIELTHGYQSYDFIYVDDAVRAIELVLQQGKNQCSYYIGNKKPQVLRTYIQQMKEITGSSSELLFGKIPLKMHTLEYTEFDTARLKEDFGWEPKVSFEEGIERLMAYERRS